MPRAAAPLSKQEKSAAKASERLTEIAEAATACFSELGFRRTQVADIARRMKVSVGTIYLYVDSKEALFHLAVMHVSRQPLADLPTPVTDPGIKKTTALLTREVASRAYWPELVAALKADAPPDLAAFEAVGGALYDTLTAERRIIWLLDACNLDIPDLNEIYRARVRGTYLIDLTRLVQRLPGAERSGGYMAIAIRAAVEIIAWAAMHRRRERGLPDEYQASEAEARDAAKRAFASALLGIAS
jgi:AcrR family transcriptional regulator